MKKLIKFMLIPLICTLVISVLFAVVAMFPEREAAGKLASIVWKEYVSLAQKWYSWAPKGSAEEYTEKIKKFDPSYEMPKKAGCISLADSKN